MELANWKDQLEYSHMLVCVSQYVFLKVSDIVETVREDADQTAQMRTDLSSLSARVVRYHHHHRIFD